MTKRSGFIRRFFSTAWGKVRNFKLIVHSILQVQLAHEIEQIKSALRAKDPDAIALHGFKVYSQFDEDGIIERIFSKIGEKSRVFVEIGCGKGLENNTHYLLLKGWRGLWVDGNADNINFIADRVGREPNNTLSMANAFITRDNVNEVIAGGLRKIGFADTPGEIDFLSLDIDGNDLEVLRHITVTAPRVFCVEYNAKFPPPLEITMAYEPDYVCQGDDYQGASLQSFVNELEPRGYRLVCCNLSGVNAFFVREGELGSIQPRAAEDLYQPPRYHFLEKQSGHAPSLKFLRDLMRESAGNGAG